MPLIDDRGKLLGTLNVVDAAALLVVVIMLPLMYGAYLLFRPSPSRLVAINPVRVERGTAQIDVRGEHLRPPLRMTIGDFAVRLLLADAESGVFELPPLLPGTYDVILLDEGQEIDRLPGALTVFMPRLVAVDPARIEEGTTRIRVHGEHLHPSVRVVVGDSRARLLLADAKNAELELPPLPPGTYDVVLLEQEQEIGRLPGALTVFAAPKKEVLQPSSTIAELVAIGTFNMLGSKQAEQLWNTLRTAEHGTRLWKVLGVEPPERDVLFAPSEMLPLTDGRLQIRAVLTFRCTFDRQQCIAFNVGLGPNALVPVPLDRTTDAIFRIGQVHPVYTDVVDITLRSALTPEELAAAREQLSTGPDRSITASFEPSLQSLDLIGESANREHIVHSRVRVPVINTADGWRHGSRVLRMGDGFAVSRGSYQVSGRIIEIEPASPLSIR